MVVARRTARVALYALTIAANAALLFAVEPLVSKRVLPLFGGAPSVWNTCLMAFQALLLAGYMYAHLSARLLGVRGQTLAHGALFVLSLLALPPVVRHVATPAGWPPAAWLLVLLLGAVGAPFLVLSAGAPLLQRWFAADDGAGDPYFLYAASNAGSMLALLGYPLLMEPWLGVAAQARAWAWGYALLGAALAACATWSWRGDAIAPSRSIEAHAAAPTWRARAQWTFLAFVPSSLLLGVTRYVTTDVAPVPMLWVVPLALYLLTFVLAFADRARVDDELLEPMVVLALPTLVLLSTLGVTRPLWLTALIHVAAVGVLSLACHQALADRRPAPARLTEFYLYVSLGGLAGGVFNALVAPAAFDSLAEYPIAMALAALAWASTRPREARDASSRAARLGWYVGLPLVAGCLLFAAVMIRADVPTSMEGTVTAALAVPAALLPLALRRRRQAFALGTCALLAGGALGARLRDGNVLLRARSFFGTYTVRASGTSGAYHHLQNGTTLHGAQDTRAPRTPLTYYHDRGPLAALFGHLPALRRPRRVAVVGLGTGTIACWGQRGERWTFYEIDPLVVRIARDPRYFTFLRDCPPTSDVQLGDARLRLADAPPATYDLLVLDAFSSDAIPTHLLTREALALYRSRLTPDGVLVLHVSNRYLDLVSVASELARDARIAGSVGDDVSGESRRHPMLSSSRWIALAARASTLGPITRQRGWGPLPPSARVRLWTDDFTDVLSVVKWR